MLLVTVLVLLFCLSGAAVGAETVADADKLGSVREYVESQRLAAGLPGIAVGIVVDDRVVFSDGFGEATLGSEPMTPQHVTVIASLSKSITAMALMLLVDDGLVDLDAPLASYLPELAPSGDSVTVREVMHHRSGLTRRIGNDPFVGDIGATLEANVSRLSRDFVADSGFEYSNANYDTLALLVERVSGMPYPEFVASRVFDPVDMGSSTVGSGGASNEDLATGYYHHLLLGYRPHTPWMQDGMVGSYMTLSNVEDLLKYAMVHINGGTYRGNQVISPESLAVLHEPRRWGPDNFPVGYGGGLNIYPAGEFETASRSGEFTQLVHDGSSPSYRSFIVMSPDGGTGVVVLANGNDTAFEGAIPQIASGIVDILYDGTAASITKPDGLERWGKHLLLLLVAIQIGLAIASIPMLRRVRSSGIVGAKGWVIVGLASALDLVALYLLVVFIPTDSETRLAVSFSLPDYRILYMLMGLGITWGIVQAGLVTYWKLRPAVPAPTPL